MNNTDLERIVGEVVNARIQSGEIAHAELVIRETIEARGEIAGEDEAVEFYGLCAHEHVARVVKKVINKRQEDDEEGGQKSDQLLFEGFEYLRSAYTLHRAGDLVIVPLEQMTDDEIDARAEDLDRSSEGCKAHANELRRYKGMRSNIVTPTAAR